MTPPQISVAYPQFLLENFNIQSAETSSRYVILQTGFALPAGFSLSFFPLSFSFSRNLNLH